MSTTFAGTQPAASSTTPFQSGAEEESYIVQAAEALGLDPKAVLAVAAHEGVTLPSELGDETSPGDPATATSFGPWQLHYGGALPPSIYAQGVSAAQGWANSPAGLSYALQGIKSAVGASTQGDAEIQAQVVNFERSTAPTAETAASQATYAAGGGPSLRSSLPSAGSSSPFNVAPAGTASPATGTALTSTGALGASSSLSGLPSSLTALYGAMGLPPAGTTNSTITKSQAQAIFNAINGGTITQAQANQLWPDVTISSTFSITGWVSDIESYLEQWGPRVLEVVGGAVLVLAGLVILAKPGGGLVP